MNKKELLEKLCEIISDCYEDDGEPSSKQEHLTYRDGLTDALKLINTFLNEK